MARKTLLAVLLLLVRFSAVAFLALGNASRDDHYCWQTGDGEAPALALSAPASTDTDDERTEIARNLFTACLEHYRSIWVLSARLLDFRIDRVELYRAPVEPRAYAKITYSVWPLLATGDWVAGNGRQGGGWIVGKVAFINLGREGDRYWIRSMGTGP